ncbi:hypothetical protein SNK04_013576 [Fusarium graminearum]
MKPVKQSDLKGLVDRGNPEPSLICNSIKIGTLCGDLDSEHRVHEFNEYLNNPLAKEEERHMWRPETTPPHLKYWTPPKIPSIQFLSITWRQISNFFSMKFRYQTSFPDWKLG